MTGDGTGFEPCGEMIPVVQNVSGVQGLDAGKLREILILQPAFETQQVQPMVLDTAFRIVLHMKIGGKLKNQAIHGESGLDDGSVPGNPRPPI